VAAALVYARMRQPAIDAVGDERFVNLILGRAFGYIGFGTLSGWAARQLEASLEKLDVYDVVDDQTGLHNARFFVQDTDLEMARAARYQTLFSVVVVDIPSAALDRLGRRARAAALRHLGRRLREAVRSMDRAVHARDGNTHRFVVVCPETGPEGARIFADRLADSITDLLRERGVRLADGAPLARSSYTYPGDDARLSTLREEFAAIDRAEHPDHPVGVTGPPPGGPGAPA
jgi:diguanylate cyclase (GGDEF)-like protein